MILRSLMKHVRDQNWIAVALDFIIVVVGVFIGIQVSNWNAARADHVREARYLDNLAIEIREEIVALDEMMLAHRMRITVIEKMLTDAGGAPPRRESRMSAPASAVDLTRKFPAPEFLPITEEERDYFLNYGIFARTFNEKNSTFRTLQSTGDITIFKDETLALDITDYYANIEDLIYFEDGTARHARDATTAVARRHGFNPFGENSYDLVVTALQEDPEFAASLRGLYNVSILNHFVIATVKREAEEILARLPDGEE
ncbi:hypothetical protein [Parvularcula marina]|uniref:Uncharacterized protein n=1 Tax=Parvularcula marina TaxID=2292771 RepID=A0A371RFF2_9PROT|nr:hypothetical protein [Parvularcula marina]RFB04179.1 hypothetical protein DX908_02105 [Parvularcula marina]